MTIHSYPCELEVYFSGDPLEKGVQPALFYFALSAKKSLTLDPFNSPLQFIEKNTRVFSITLPMHEDQEEFVDPMSSWIDKLKSNDPFLDTFLQQAHLVIENLEKQGVIAYPSTGLSGLSRGGYIALQLARRLPIDHIVAFAPFLDFKDIAQASHPSFSQYNLLEKIDEFANKKIQIYIGNQDTRVNTDASYQFIKQAAALSSPGSFELFIRNSIGHKGHGTPQEAFQQGTVWLENKIH